MVDMDIDMTALVLIVIAVAATVAAVVGPLSGEDLKIILIAIIAFLSGRVYENNRLKASARKKQSPSPS